MPRPKNNAFIAQMADQDRWMDEAACRTSDPRMFDTTMINQATLVDAAVREAMEVCAECPVMMTCLEHAVHHDIRHGVWGGMVYEDRLAWAQRHRPDLLPAKLRLELATAA